MAVIGGGPAGSAAALTLAHAGRRVVIIDASTTPEFKIGEALPPAARPLLRDLGVLDRFNSDRHLPSFGNQSAWGGPTLRNTDFIRDPNGLGWHLDRPRFDTTLREAAQISGAEVRTATHLWTAARDTTTGWRLMLRAPSGRDEVRASWLIDCTGRLSLAARAQGARRENHDRLVGLVALFRPRPGQAPDRDSLTLIESEPHGWWYTALLPTNQRVVVYFTDSDLDTFNAARNAEGYMEAVNRTEHVRARLASRGYTMNSEPEITAANSARLDHMTGDGWIAAGDAAISFDPVSSQGIFNALYSGLKAGRALESHLSGEPSALELYDRHLTSIYDAYFQNRTTFYRYERRWPASTFWKRRWNPACLWPAHSA